MHDECEGDATCEPVWLSQTVRICRTRETLRKRREKLEMRLRLWNEWNLHRLFRSSMWLHARLRRTSNARRPLDWSRHLSVLRDTPEDTSRRIDHWHLAQERKQKDRPKMTITRYKASAANQQRRFVQRSHFPMKSRSQWRQARYSCRSSSRWSSWLGGIPVCHAPEACDAGRRTDWQRSLQSGQPEYLPCHGHRHRYGPP